MNIPVFRPTFKSSHKAYVLAFAIFVLAVKSSRWNQDHHLNNDGFKSFKGFYYLLAWPLCRSCDLNHVNIFVPSVPEGSKLNLITISIITSDMFEIIIPWESWVKECHWPLVLKHSHISVITNEYTSFRPTFKSSHKTSALAFSHICSGCKTVKVKPRSSLE